MNRIYILEQLFQNNSNAVAQLDKDSYILGREDDESDIVIDNSVVSRQHAKIAKCGSFWMYQDLESTNGSWINGERLQGKRWYFLRCSDALQIADLDFQLACYDEGGKRIPFSSMDELRSRMLVVMKGDQFVAEFKVPEYGKALVIGGSSTNLELEGDIFDQPSLVIERRGENVVLYSVVKEFPLYLNGEQITELTNLKDGDEIRLLSYTVYFSMPTLPQPTYQSASEDEVEEIKNKLQDWNDSSSDFTEQSSFPKSKPVGNFGKKVFDDMDDTFTIEADDIEERANRFKYEDDSSSSIENRVILVFGIIFTVILLIVVAIYFLLPGKQ